LFFFFFDLAPSQSRLKNARSVPPAPLPLLSAICRSDVFIRQNSAASGAGPPLASGAFQGCSRALRSNLTFAMHTQILGATLPLRNLSFVRHNIIGATEGPNDTDGNAHEQRQAGAATG